MKGYGGYLKESNDKQNGFEQSLCSLKGSSGKDMDIQERIDSRLLWYKEGEVEKMMRGLCWRQGLTI